MSTPLEIKNLGLRLPITEQARQIAQRFSEIQSTPEKAKQVQLNTLAVWVVNDYCQMMDIPTELDHSDSWNPVVQVMANVADLVLPEIGRLECRPVRSEAQTCFVPPEVWDCRVGYVVVEIDDALQSAQLIGFTPAVTTEELPIAKLLPLEDLLDHLYTLRQASLLPALDGLAAGAVEAAVNLSQWLNDTFETSWQAVESVLNPDRMAPAVSFRRVGIDEGTTPELTPSRIRRAKLIDLAVQLGLRQVVLLVNLQPEASEQTYIGLQVHPAAGQPYLPSGLELAILEPSDAVFMQAQSRQADNYIQLRFSGKPGERFRIRITLEDARYLEEFVI
ncbi:DUF1822 family protein [Romeria aff. gracilis LEGE 07310]|uniref:DUF1822 family protein n=1 Tax=Vasconcelosia minhoensis LEGE 07310 TaxID=915328 RepID=A0A8J7AVA0_9CYAN|nr:DUF1822 family protein [Romeria gracilis]MBE9077568.1 DUF1822 family protein [Romeria aff. gracilis LEGE 07310]